MIFLIDLFTVYTICDLGLFCYKFRIIQMHSICLINSFISVCGSFKINLFQWKQETEGGPKDEFIEFLLDTCYIWSMFDPWQIVKHYFLYLWLKSYV